MDAAQTHSEVTDDGVGAVRVTHVITGLQPNGAERMLLWLVRNLDRRRFSWTVIGLSGPGPIGDALSAEGVPVTALGLRPYAPSPRAVASLARVIRESRPDVVHTWMYQADVLGGVLARATTDARVVWHLHGSSSRRSKAHHRASGAVAARLSRRVPDRIVSVGHALVDLHAARGYPRDRMVVIPIGFDLDRFVPDDAARASVRAELRLAEEAPLVGLMARYGPQKDHETALRAARVVVDRRPGVRFLLCGPDVHPGNAELAAIRARLGLEDDVLLLGPRDDVPRLTAALDVAMLSSAYGEGCPAALCEALACGVPCASTDVGDAALVVGDSGSVVPPRDPEALGRAIADLLALSAEERRRLAEPGRARMLERFEVGAVVRRYEQLYLDLVGGERRPVPAGPMEVLA